MTTTDHYTHTQLTTHEITYLEFITGDRLTRWKCPTIEFCIKVQFLYSAQYFITPQTYTFKTQKLIARNFKINNLHLHWNFVTPNFQKIQSKLLILLAICSSR